MLTRFKHLWYVPVLVMALGLMSIRLLLFAKLLNVSDYGIYSAGLLISSSFLMLGCLGLYSLLQREQPIMLVRGRNLAANIILLQCILVTIVCSLILSSLIRFNDLSFAGLRSDLVVLSLLHGLANQLFLVVSLESRSRGETMRFAKQNLGRAGFVLISGIVVALVFRNATSVLIAEILCSILLFLWILRKQFLNISVGLLKLIYISSGRFDRIQWRSAFTLFTVNAVAFVLVNADRWIISENFTPYDFGQYAFSWIIISIAQSVQMVINASVFPMLARNYASGGTLHVFKKAIRVSLITLCLGVILALPLLFILNYSIERWFTNYTEARYLLPIFMIISLFRLSDFWSSYLIIVGRENQLLFINFSILLLGIVFWFFLIQPDVNLLKPSKIALLALFLTMVGYFLAVLCVFRHAFIYRKFNSKKY